MFPTSPKGSWCYLPNMFIARSHGLLSHQFTPSPIQPHREHHCWLCKKSWMSACTWQKRRWFLFQLTNLHSNSANVRNNAHRPKWYPLSNEIIFYQTHKYFHKRVIFQQIFRYLCYFELWSTIGFKLQAWSETPESRTTESNGLHTPAGVAGCESRCFRGLAIEIYHARL